MLVLNSLNEILEQSETFSQGTSITIGVFDGIHLGHRALISRCVKEAQTLNHKSVVLTFQQHPLAVLAPAYAPQKLLSGERKQELIKDLGCDIYLNIPFTQDFAKMQPEKFVKEILVGTLYPKVIVVGYDFTFGWQGLGNMDMLKRLGKDYGFNAINLHPVSCGDLRVKSTMIRETLNLGQVDIAAWMLGRTYELVGKVVKGLGRGCSLGYPTANLYIDPQYALPASGVYAVRVHIHGDWRNYGAMLNIGKNPTFNAEKMTVEVHLISFDGDLLDKNLTVYFIKRLRDEKKFESQEDLIKQLGRDEIAAREALGRTQTN